MKLRTLIIAFLCFLLTSTLVAQTTDVQLLQNGWRPEQHTSYLHKQAGSETVTANRLIWKTDTGPNLDSYICYGSSSDPITFDIPINQDTKDLKNVKLTLSVYDVDEAQGEVDKVYVNGNYVGTLHGANDSWSVNSYTVNAAWLKGGTAASPGHNIITVDITVTGWCVTVDWGAISADANVFSALSYTPKSAQTMVDFTAPDIKVTFSEEPDMSTISSTTFQVAYFDQSAALVPASGTYSASGKVVTFTPSGSLLDGVKYAVTLSAGTSGIKSKGGAQLDKQVKWNFTTTPNMVIDKVVPVQTSEGSDMIALKRGMIRVYATWDLKPQVHSKAQADRVTAKVSVESNGAAAGTRTVIIKRRDLITGPEKRTGRQSVNFFDWSPPTGGNSLKATIEITQHNAAIAKTEKTSNYVTLSKSVNLRFQYFGLQVAAWATTPSSVPWATLDLNVQQARVGMDQQFPIMSVASTAGGLFNPGLPKPLKYALITELNYVAMKLYEQWQRTLQAGGTQFIVGYVPNGYLGGGTMGGEGFTQWLTNWGGNTVNILTEGSNSGILPHEFGHAWSLGHSGPSPSIEGYEIDLSGKRGRQRSISAGSVDVTSLMDPEPGSLNDAFIMNSDYNTLLTTARKSTMRNLSQAAATPVFLIAGFFDPSDVLTLDPIRRQDFTNVNPPTIGAYTIEQLNSTNSVIATNNFDPAGPILGTDGRQYRMFSVGVPYNAATQRIRIRKGTTQLQDIIRSANAPVVTITAPTSNAIWSGQRTVTWTGTDADGNALTYDVSYSPDNGTTWQVLALETSATSLLLNTDLIPQGSSCKLNVSASDGFNTTIATASFTVSNSLKVMSTIPASSATAVPLTSSVSAQFRSSLQNSSISASNFTLTTGGVAVSGAVSYDAVTRVIRFVPTVELSYNTLYTARVKAGIQDSSGNSLASDYTWTFTTEADASSLEVESVSPEAATVGVAVNAPISIKFTKPVNTSTLNTTNIKLVSQAGATVAGSVTYDAVQRLATFKPNASLATNTRYTCTVTTAVTSSDAKPLSAQYDWFFVTGTDSTSAISFTGRFTDRIVDKNGNGLSDSLLVDIEVMAVVPGTFSINGRLADARGNEIMWAALQSLSLPAGTSIITLPFDGKLINAYSTDGPYQLTDLMIYSTQNTNISDWLSLATNTATYRYTQFEQSTTPAAIDFYPLEGATKVPVNVVVSVRFTRPMDPTTITTSSFTLRDYQNAIVPATVKYDTATKVATLDPTSDLLADSLYSVSLTTSIRGSNGTALLKFYSWSFATGGGSAAVTSIGEVISYPNPFPHESLPSGGMRFTYVLAAPGKVKIRVYSVAADFIMEIPETIAPARQGYNEVGWNGANEGGTPVASGTYVYIIYYTDADNAEHRAVGKFTVVR